MWSVVNFILAMAGGLFFIGVTILAFSPKWCRETAAQLVAYASAIEAAWDAFKREGGAQYASAVRAFGLSEE